MQPATTPSNPPSLPELDESLRDLRQQIEQRRFDEALQGADRLLANRSDIRSEPSNNSVKEGVPLTLNIVVASIGNNSCTPLQGAQVDVWHCDAQGQYSGVSDRGFDTSGQKFLRGFQRTDASGRVQFLTIYPGWYSGRAVHIHFTIRTQAASGGDYQFTSQFFFDDSLTDQVHALEPYASKGQRDTRNSTDNIFNGGGEQLLLDLQGDTIGGFTGTMNIGLDLTDTEVGAADSMSGPGGPGGPRILPTPRP